MKVQRSLRKEGRNMFSPAPEILERVRQCRTFRAGRRSGIHFLPLRVYSKECSPLQGDRRCR